MPRQLRQPAPYPRRPTPWEMVVWKDQALQVQGSGHLRLPTAASGPRSSCCRCLPSPTTAPRTCAELTWRKGPVARYQHTIDVVGAQTAADGTYVARTRLVGNFPSGTVDLTSRFAVDGDRITRLVLAP